jgi:hypothetical protein
MKGSTSWYALLLPGTAALLGCATLGTSIAWMISVRRPMRQGADWGQYYSEEILALSRRWAEVSSMLGAGGKWESRRPINTRWAPGSTSESTTIVERRLADIRGMLHTKRHVEARSTGNDIVYELLAGNHYADMVRTGQDVADAFFGLASLKYGDCFMEELSMHWHRAIVTAGSPAEELKLVVASSRLEKTEALKWVLVEFADFGGTEELRCCALEALARYRGDRAVEDVLRTALRDPSKAVRDLAAGIMWKRPSEE